jgi:hypothetical protein
MADELEYDVETLRQSLMAALDESGKRTDLYPTVLAEKFPRILARIVELWGKPELDAYFQNDLLTTNRPNRQGFPPEVAVELFRLSNYHASLGLSVATAASPWDWAADAEYFNKKSNQ